MSLDTPIYLDNHEYFEYFDAIDISINQIIEKRINLLTNTKNNRNLTTRALDNHDHDPITLNPLYNHVRANSSVLVYDMLIDWLQKISIENLNIYKIYRYKIDHIIDTLGDYITPARLFEMNVYNSNCDYVVSLMNSVDISITKHLYLYQKLLDKTNCRNKDYESVIIYDILYFDTKLHESFMNCISDINIEYHYNNIASVTNLLISHQ